MDATKLNGTPKSAVIHAIQASHAYSTGRFNEMIDETNRLRTELVQEHPELVQEPKPQKHQVNYRRFATVWIAGLALAVSGAAGYRIAKETATHRPSDVQVGSVCGGNCGG